MTWNELSDTDKREATRDALVTRSMSYGEAARYLGTTRSSIAGVVNRSHKYGEPIPRMSATTKRAVQIARAAKARAAKPPRPIKEKRVPNPRKPKKSFAYIPDIPEDAIDRVPARTDVWNALPGSSPVPVELHTAGCRWPCGADLPFTFCNEPTDGASVYCSTHSAIAFRPALPVTRLPKGARS